MEKSCLFHRQREETYGVRNVSGEALRHSTNHTRGYKSFSHEAISNRDVPSTSQAGEDQVERRIVPRTKAGPPPFYTATSLYRSHLPSNPQQRDQHVACVGAEESLSALHRSSTPRPSENELPMPSKWFRAVPSPTACEALATSTQVPESKRYSTPPWWRRRIGGDAVEEEEKVAVSEKGPVLAAGGKAAVSSASITPDPKTSDIKAGQVSSGRMDANVLFVHRNRREDSGCKVTPSRAPPPPPSRSCTHSVVPASRSATASPSPSATNPMAADDETNGKAEFPLRHADPDDYCQPLYGADRRKKEDMVEDKNKHLAPPGKHDKKKHAALQNVPEGATAFQFYRDAHASSSPTTSSAATVHNSARPTASYNAKQRLRIYQASAAHPSGYAVPRRGAGEAAPRTLYNGLTVLPATVGDREAVTRTAATSGQTSVIYGTGNHPSTYSIQKYREGIAAVTGVDPSQLREGVLNQRYTRVHCGWKEVAGESRSSSFAEASQQLQATATRLRLGLSGGGAPRAAALLDPISGQSRKPNEVAVHYLKHAVREAAAGRAKRISSKPNTSAITGIHDNEINCSFGHPQCSPQSVIFSHSYGRRGEGEWSLAAERRRRADQRLLQLRATHGPSGVPLLPDEKRLYWAEQAPLHRTNIRCLNALLMGVGEAEPDDYEDSNDVVSYSDLNDGVGSVSTWSEKDGLAELVAHSQDERDSHHFDQPHLSIQGDTRVASMRRTAHVGAAAMSAFVGDRAAPSAKTEENPHKTFSISRSESRQTNAERARLQLEDALRQRRGAESTLSASSIIPAAYRYSCSPVRAEYEDTEVVYENEVHCEAATQPSGDMKISFDGREGGKDESGGSDLTGGLVDSHLHRGASSSSLNLEREAFSYTHSNDHRRQFGSSSQQPDHRATGDSIGGANAVRNRTNEYFERADQAVAQRASSREVHHAVSSPSYATLKGRHPSHTLRQSTLLFPPLMTPLLQEVDECLRFHGMPILREVWQWGVADQTVLLRAAGFSAAECQTITWELERMIRTTSTTCAVAV